VAQVVGQLPSKYEAPRSNPSIEKKSVKFIFPSSEKSKAPNHVIQCSSRQAELDIGESVFVTGD
jgi:hypothetical protein